jgi:phosphoribosylformylglycinamidine synthase
MRFLVSISRRDGLADPEGATTARALRDLGYDEVGDVHFGQTILVEVSGDDVDAARSRIDEMCRRLLANPVIEDFTIEALP